MGERSIIGGKEKKKNLRCNAGAKKNKGAAKLFFFFAPSHLQTHREETAQTDGKTRASFFFEEGKRQEEKSCLLD